MVIGGKAPHKFVLVENPKCASTSLRWAFRELGGEPILQKHSRLVELEDRDDYRHKVCVVRNPWDRMVSAWSYAGKNYEFEEWLTDQEPWANYGIDMKRTPQIAWSFRCNHTVKYEYLEESWPKLLERMQLPFVPLPKRNTSEHKPYQEYYNDRTREIVADRFGPDIKQFGYTFE